MKALSKAICLVMLVSGASALLAQQPSPCGEDRERLIVGSDFAGTLGYTPFEFFDQNSTPPELTGFDVEVACQIANRLGFEELEFRQIPFPDLLDEVESESDVNIGISAISMTESRILDPADLAFVNYNDDTLGMIFNDDVDQQFLDPNTVLAELNSFGEMSGGVVIAVTAGSRQLNILQSTVYEFIIPLVFDTLTEAVDALKDETETVFGVFVDGPTALSVAAGDSEVVGLNNVAVDPEADDVSLGLGIAVPGSCCQLFVDIQQAIDDMVADGTLALLREEFNVGDFTPLGEDTSPPGCDAEPDINSNVLNNFIFTKFCPCDAQVIS